MKKKTLEEAIIEEFSKCSKYRDHAKTEEQDLNKTLAFYKEVLNEYEVIEDDLNTVINCNKVYYEAIEKCGEDKVKNLLLIHGIHYKPKKIENLNVFLLGIPILDDISTSINLIYIYEQAEEQFELAREGVKASLVIKQKLMGES